VLAVGVFARFYHLDRKLLWHDEVYTTIFTAGYQSRDWEATLYTGRVVDVAEMQRFLRYDPEKRVLDTIRGLARDEPQHPPAYYVLARIWVGVLGDGIGTLRALSALLSLLAFPAIWWLCREMFGSARIAWTGVVLHAVSPFFVLYAQEAREYALWGVLILLSTAALLRAIRRTEGAPEPPLRRVGAWAPYVLFTTLALYTSFSTASVLLAHALYLAIRERMRPTRVALWFGGALAASGLLFLPWAVTLLRHFEAFQASMAWAETIVVPRRELLALLALNVSRQVVDLWPDLDHLAAIAVVALAVALVAGAIVSLVRRTPLRTSALALCLIAVPILFLLVPDLLFGGIRSVSARYLVPSWIGVEVALAFLLGSAFGEDRRWTALAAVVVAAGLASCLLNAKRDVAWTKGISIHLPEVARAVNQSASPLVIANREHHNPGNLLALCNLLAPGTKIWVWTGGDATTLPQNDSDVFLFSPTDPFRRDLERREGVTTRLLVGDLHLQLWKVEPADPP